MNKGKLFISYAREDDENFVKVFWEDLKNRGFDVWWDREAMESRDAIAGVDRVILVVGPKAVVSDYVRFEWQFALEICKPVLPILRIGDYNLIPDELSGSHAPDFRTERSYEDAMEELLRILHTPVPPLGDLYGVDALPPNFIKRPDYMKILKNAILPDTSRPVVITSVQRASALHGMGGMGKSVLAAAFARDCETRRTFPDGVIWVKLGQKVKPEELVN